MVIFITNSWIKSWYAAGYAPSVTNTVVDIILITHQSDLGELQHQEALLFTNLGKALL